ncbi:MAG: hypothetical protein ACXQS5_04265 [Candidatus Methanospirareceae archaeon]
MKLSKPGKVVICLAVIGMVVGSIEVSYILKERGGEAETLLPELPKEQPREGTLIGVGSGWSVKNDEQAAVEEAVSSARAELKGKSPEFAILFSTVGYDRRTW